MPLYEYRCEACGEKEEHVQRFSDPPMTVCQACGGVLKKQITGAAFHLKGGGWYKDGYASSKPSGGSAEGGSSSGGSESTSKSGSEGATKPASTTSTPSTGGSSGSSGGSSGGSST